MFRLDKLILSWFCIFLIGCSHYQPSNFAFFEVCRSTFKYNPSEWTVITQNKAKVELEYNSSFNGYNGRVFIECFSYHDDNLTIYDIAKSNFSLFTKYYDKVTYDEITGFEMKLYKINFEILRDSKRFEMYLFEKNGKAYSILFYSNKKSFIKFKDHFKSFINLVAV
jgi:hypothetical protein